MLTKCVHIILAIWLLISSMGIVVNKHFCQQELQHWALFVKAKSCKEHTKAPACPFHPPPEESKKDCCEDKAAFFKIDTEYLGSQAKLLIPALSQPIIFVPVGLSLIDHPLFWSSPVHYLNYKPPLLQCDRQILLQTFLC